MHIEKSEILVWKDGLNIADPSKHAQLAKWNARYKAILEAILTSEEDSIITGFPYIQALFISHSEVLHGFQFTT